jgi:hypothetical protein
MPTPYYLTPKATKLPAGHDDTLDPAEAPVDAEERSVAPSEWPVTNAARGGTGPPDGPLGPPATHPARRALPPFRWPAAAGGVIIPNRPLAETPSPLFDLDPDIALWPVTLLQRWPFTGPPTVGVWPKGWLGADNTATLYICTVAGEPGTWAAIGTGSAGPPGPSGPAGPAGTPGPAGPGVIFVGQYVLPGNFGAIGAGLSSPIVAMNVSGNGLQRFTVAVQGVISRSTTDAAGDVNLYLVRSDNPGTALATMTNTVPVNARASFFAEVSDVPPGSLDYWMLGSSTGNFATILAGARMMIWQSG